MDDLYIYTANMNWRTAVGRVLNRLGPRTQCCLDQFIVAVLLYCTSLYCL